MTSRRGRLDVAIVGGGVVGSAAALALAGLGLDVALIEAVEPPGWQTDQPDVRVYAFAPDNAAMLDAMGVWRGIVDARALPYRRMRVWDAAGGHELAFDADAFGRRELGWIVEHGLLVDRLWTALPAAGVRVHCAAKVHALEQDDSGIRLQLSDGTAVDARIAVAADGAESTLRGLAGIGVDRHDYAQRGIVAYVDTELPHQATAWQRFLPSGPLAFLPCADESGIARPGHRSSIVWTLPEDEASRLLALAPAAFDQALARAFDGRLGSTSVQSPRAAFPLRRQLVRDYAIGQVLVLGDAAHVVHPLAGQGVNLGLRDVGALRRSIAAAQTAGADWASPLRLARWARTRKSENSVAAYAFDAMNRTFGSDRVAATLFRGPLLGVAGHLPPLVQLLWKRASGV